MAVTLKEVQEWIEEGKRQKAEYMISVWDSFDEDYTCICNA